MDNYEELIRQLDEADVFGESEGKMKDYKELTEHPELCWDYIDRLRIAIEQLVKERDAAITDLSHVLHSLGYDAVLYSESVCGYCKHKGEKDGECQQDCYSTAEKWEWRGVQDETD